AMPHLINILIGEFKMRICRKYGFSVMFFVSVAIFLLPDFSAAYCKSVNEHSVLLNRLVHLSSKIPHSVIDRLTGCAATHKCGKKTSSDFEIFLRNLRMTLNEDWISKLILLNNASRFRGRVLYFCRRSGVMPPELTPSPGFH